MKRVILFIAIVLPVAIYIFLQGFGKNIYELPKLYQSPADLVSISGCSNNISFPYTIQMDTIELNKTLPVLIYIAFGESKDIAVENEFVRINEYFSDLTIQRLTFTQNPELYINQKVYHIDDLDAFAKCIFFQTTNNSFVVLVDKNGVIRSNYTDLDRADFDRMIVEVELIKEFN